MLLNTRGTSVDLRLPLLVQPGGIGGRAGMGWIQQQLDNLDRLPCRLGAPAPTPWDYVHAGRVTRLYAGSLDWDDGDFSDYCGIRLAESSPRNLIQNVSAPLPIADNTIDSVMAEDVLEYPPNEALPAILDEIFRAPKPGG